MKSSNLNINRISKFASIYFKLCEAGLKEDMAKRIMYSVIPHLSSQLQTSVTGGTIDVNALRTAVEGRTNIIKYGGLAVSTELAHYGNSGVSGLEFNQSDIRNKYDELWKSGKQKEAMDMAVKAFSERKAWASSFGGGPWEQIAKTLFKLIELDKSLNRIRSTRERAEDKDPYSDPEVQVMKLIIVEMNVFDGLSHNTDSILRNVVELENLEQGGSSYDSNSEKEYKEILKLMDAKELEDPVDVYKSIEDTLKSGGDLPKFRDWVTKLRSRPEYHRSSSHKGQKLFIIRLRKSLMHYRAQMNEYRDSFKTQIESLDNHFDRYESESARASITNFSYIMRGLIESLEHMSGSFKRNNEHILNKDSLLFIDNYIKKLSDKCNEDATKIENIRSECSTISREIQSSIVSKPTIPPPSMLGAAPSFGEDVEVKRILLTKKLREAYTIANGFAYLLDSI